MTVNVLGQSGKMTLSNGPNQVTVTMDSLFELNAAGSIIGNSGPNAQKHSRQTFASVDFTISNQTRRTAEFGVPAHAIDFRTTLLGSSELVVSTFIFLHNGVIHPTANESWAVAGGSIKFSVQLNAWPFCSVSDVGVPCQGEAGAFIELGIEIKGSADATLAGGDGKRFTLATNAATGNNVTLELSDEILLDGAWVRMPTGYPKIEVQGGKQLFKFRFPRFASSCLYDPVVNGLGGSVSTQPALVAAAADPCFPSSALVTMADGTLTRLDALKEGDVIVATTAEGTLTTDTVSLLSIAKPEATATTFVTLTADTGKSLNLTAEHYLPVGAECCSTLKQAKEIVVGETVWAVEGGAVVARIVTKKSHATHKGLHSPVLTGGALPVVDGFVTAFDGPAGVLLASYALKPLLRTCKATGTCPVVKRVVAALTGRTLDEYIA